MITMNRDRFVYFDDTGEITKITNYLEEDDESFIKIDYSHFFKNYSLDQIHDSKYIFSR